MMYKASCLGSLLMDCVSLDLRGEVTSRSLPFISRAVGKTREREGRVKGVSREAGDERGKLGTAENKEGKKNRAKQENL